MYSLWIHETVCYYHAALSSPNSRNHHQSMWESGSLRCVLITTKNPETFAVHVFHGDSPVCVERCADAEEALKIAQHFWTVFVDRIP